MTLTRIQATTFFEALTYLPPALEHFALGWEFQFDYDDYDDEDAPTVDTPSGFSELRDALVGTCPGLKSLSFDGPEFLYRWSRSLEGTEVETCVTGAGECPLSTLICRLIQCQTEDVELMRKVLRKPNESRDK
jgi:hypothetical protein